MEHCELTSSTMLNEHIDWPGVKQVCRLRRKTLRQGGWRTEVAYGLPTPSPVSSVIVPPRQCCCNGGEGTWRIENKVHWVRDETFGEDRSRKTDNLAAALRENGWNLQPLFTMLGKQNQ